MADCDWAKAHAALTRLARERATADAEEGSVLLHAFRAAVHAHLGHGSFAEYVERVFGYRVRTTREKLRVAEALENLPELARALDRGEVGWCAVRELTRVAVAETEDAWLAAARGKTIRQLEELVAKKSPGDTPDEPEKPRPRSRVLRFEVAPETFALFRDAMRKLRRAAGGGLDDDAVLLAMARHVLAGPTFLDVHHIRPRSEGGGNHPANLIAICSSHHRAAHRGELLLESSPDGSPLFRHADGSAYGQAIAPRVVDAQTKVFAALRHLGFRERDVRAVLAELRADEELRETTAERLLREALCRIRPIR